MDKVTKFLMKDELGISIECYKIASTKYENDDYIIYTDFINDKNGKIRLLVGKIDDGIIYTLDNKNGSEIIENFITEERCLLNRMEGYFV